MDIRDRMLISLGRAAVASSASGRRAFGWIRLAQIRSRVEGNEAKYVVAVRESDKHGFQLGCSCPHWINRLRFANEGRGDLCKHQKLFLAHQKGTAPKTGIWFYNAGKAFLEQFQKGL